LFYFDYLLYFKFIFGFRRSIAKLPNALFYLNIHIVLILLFFNLLCNVWLIFQLLFLFSYLTTLYCALLYFNVFNNSCLFDLFLYFAFLFLVFSEPFEPFCEWITWGDLFLYCSYSTSGSFQAWFKPWSELATIWHRTYCHLKEVRI